jgi:hypothetical protein
MTKNIPGQLSATNWCEANADIRQWDLILLDDSVIEWLVERQLAGIKLPYGHFTQHKSHMDYSGTVTGTL